MKVINCVILILQSIKFFVVLSKQGMKLLLSNNIAFFLNVKSHVLSQTYQEMSAVSNSTTAGYEHPYPRGPSSNSSYMAYSSSLRFKYNWYKNFPVF